MHCLCCKAMHSLDECTQFVKNSMDVKKEFIKNNLLCFGCLVHGHVAKYCKNRSICRQCKGKHATALHWSGIVEESRQRMSDTSGVIKNARMDIRTAKSPAPSGMVIVPVKIRSKTGPRGACGEDVGNKAWLSGTNFRRKNDGSNQNTG